MHTSAWDADVHVVCMYVCMYVMYKNIRGHIQYNICHVHITLVHT